MARDFDEEANKKIGQLLKDVAYNKQYWLDAELKWWNDLPYEVKKKKAMQLMTVNLSKIPLREMPGVVFQS